VKRPGHEGDHPHLMPRSRKLGSIPSSPHTSSWRSAQLVKSSGTTLRLFSKIFLCSFFFLP
jgi:hypothetical protein